MKDYEYAINDFVVTAPVDKVLPKTTDVVVNSDKPKTKCGFCRKVVMHPCQDPITCPNFKV